HELVTLPLDPVPIEELAATEPDLTGPPDHRCAAWETPFVSGNDRVSIHNSLCFDHAGRPLQVFTRTAAITLADYQKFQSSSIARQLELFDNIVTIRATVVILERLKVDESLFAVSPDTGLNSRVRFVSLDEEALRSLKIDAPTIVWPTLHNFPNTGVIAIHILLDRTGTVREAGSPISPNVMMVEPVAEQIAKWRFRPYVVDGAPVQVSTDISIPFKAPIELLGANSAGLIPRPFAEMMTLSHQLSDLTTVGGKPFHLSGTFQSSSPSGSFDEIWQE